MTDIVQLLSGGFDSVGQALILRGRGHTLFPMYVQFRLGGGKPTREMACAKAFIAQYDLRPLHILAYRIPKTQYDTRNKVLCGLGEAYAMRIGVEEVAIGVPTGGINFGIMSDDDINPTKLQESINLKLHTMGMYKSAILRQLGTKDQRALFNTTSCQMWFKSECGQCYICVERHAAFIVALGYDHTTYNYNPMASKYWKTLIEQEQQAYTGQLT